MNKDTLDLITYEASKISAANNLYLKGGLAENFYLKAVRIGCARIRRLLSDEDFTKQLMAYEKFKTN